MTDVPVLTPFNPAHLDHLGKEISRDGVDYRIVYLYCEAPDYVCMGDPHEGIACVDDVARAAVVYLRHYELTQDPDSLDKARGLLRFVLYMQTPDGLFHNFVVNEQLDINTKHFRSSADGFEFWTARAVWVLGVATRVLRDVDTALAVQCMEALDRIMPHIKTVLDHYPETIEHRGRTIPAWLVGGNASDATSELMLGLTALNESHPSVDLQTMIAQFAEGIALMRYGSINVFPYGCHASNKDGWHKWGNSQTQALAEARIVTSAKAEAESFYPHLLIEGYLHSVMFDDLHAIKYFERIAYGIRSVAVGLLRLHEATDDERYLKMAGLAATWFTGHNALNANMYDSATGRGYDGINDNQQLNYNAGAESTIEALYTVLELNQYAASRLWMDASGLEPQKLRVNDVDWFLRVYEVTNGNETYRIAPAMNLTNETFTLLEGEQLDALLSG